MRTVQYLNQQQHRLDWKNHNTFINILSGHMLHNQIVIQYWEQYQGIPTCKIGAAPVVSNMF